MPSKRLEFGALLGAALCVCTVLSSEPSRSAPGITEVDLTAFVRIPLTKGWYVESSCAQPIYFDLNGPQASEQFHFSLEVGTSF